MSSPLQKRFKEYMKSEKPHPEATRVPYTKEIFAIVQAIKDVSVSKIDVKQIFHEGVKLYFKSLGKMKIDWKLFEEAFRSSIHDELVEMISGKLRTLRKVSGVSGISHPYPDSVGEALTFQWGIRVGELQSEIDRIEKGHYEDFGVSTLKEEMEFSPEHEVKKRKLEIKIIKELMNTIKTLLDLAP